MDGSTMIVAAPERTGSVVVGASTVDAVSNAPNLAELMEEYAAETKIDGLPEPKAKLDLYRRLESVGMLHVFSALIDGELVGFITVLAPEMLHYSAIVAVSESFFVAKAHRHTLAGLKLLKMAETIAKEKGSPVLQVIAPYGGKLFELLPKVGYTECSRVFCKKLSNG